MYIGISFLYQRLQQQLCNDMTADVGRNRPINPENASFDGIISRFGKPPPPLDMMVIQKIRKLTLCLMQSSTMHLHEHRRSRVTSQSSFHQNDSIRAKVTATTVMITFMMTVWEAAPVDLQKIATEGADEQEVPHPPSEVVEEVFSPMIDSFPRTKEGVMDWCRDEDDDDDDDGGEEEYIRHNLKVEKLQTIAKELYNRFKILHCQLLRHGKYENRNDLVFLLNEMTR